MKLLDDHFDQNLRHNFRKNRNDQEISFLIERRGIQRISRFESHFRHSGVEFRIHFQLNTIDQQRHQQKFNFR